MWWLAWEAFFDIKRSWEQGNFLLDWNFMHCSHTVHPEHNLYCGPHSAHYTTVRTFSPMLWLPWEVFLDIQWWWPQRNFFGMGISCNAHISTIQYRTITMGLIVPTIQLSDLLKVYWSKAVAGIGGNFWLEWLSAQGNSLLNGNYMQFSHLSNSELNWSLFSLELMVPSIQPSDVFKSLLVQYCG